MTRFVAVSLVGLGARSWRKTAQGNCLLSVRKLIGIRRWRRIALKELAGAIGLEDYKKTYLTTGRHRL